MKTFLPFILALIPGFYAPDWRLLYNKPAALTMDEFQAAWEAGCPPAVIADGLTPLGTTFEAGDFSGNNADTEARIACVGYQGPIDDPPQFAKEVAITTELADSLGATPA
ncbi:hypothetical protein BT69DRAFT_1349896 [Atractiella rhizophila]|nr:hypothetical protein BT69DRAFT_1349896 [Atractiella rhizophila]